MSMCTIADCTSGHTRFGFCRPDDFRLRQIGTHVPHASTSVGSWMSSMLSLGSAMSLRVLGRTLSSRCWYLKEPAGDDLDSVSNDSLATMIPLQRATGPASCAMQQMGWSSSQEDTGLTLKNERVSVDDRVASTTRRAVSWTSRCAHGTCGVLSMASRPPRTSRLSSQPSRR